MEERDEYQDAHLNESGTRMLNARKLKIPKNGKDTPLFFYASMQSNCISRCGFQVFLSFISKYRSISNPLRVGPGFETQ